MLDTHWRHSEPLTLSLHVKYFNKFPVITVQQGGGCRENIHINNIQIIQIKIYSIQSIRISENVVH